MGWFLLLNLRIIFSKGIELKRIKVIRLLLNIRILTNFYKNYYKFP